MRSWMKVCEADGLLPLTENVDRTLYHGTLLRYVAKIMRIGLRPSLGEFTRLAYAEYEDAGIELPELVFAADRTGIYACYSAILGAMKQEGIEDTPANIFKHGAIVVLKQAEHVFSHREDDYDEHHPETVEPGDYYREFAIKPDFFITGDRLRNFFRRNGLFVERFGDIDRRTIQAELVRQIMQKYPMKDKLEVIDWVKSLTNLQLKNQWRRHSLDEESRIQRS